MTPSKLSAADDGSFVECPVCGTRIAYGEKLYIIPFYTLDDAAKSFSVVAKGVCWECFRGRVMHGDDYKPGRPRMAWTDKDAKRMRDALWHISNSVTNGKSQIAKPLRCRKSVVVYGPGMRPKGGCLGQ